MKHLLLLIIALACSGCASLPPIDQMTVPAIAARSSVTRDDFKKITSVRSMKIMVQAYGVTEHSYHLLAVKNDGSATDYFIVVSSQNGLRESWRFWATAADKSGKEFKLDRVSSDVFGGGITRESYSTELSRSYLDTAATQFTEWRVYGSKSFLPLTLTANFVTGFLQSADAALNK